MKNKIKNILAITLSVSIILTASNFVGAESSNDITLLAHYDFNGLTSTVVTDKTGNGYDGVLDAEVVKNATNIDVNKTSDPEYGKGLTLNKNPFKDTADDITVLMWVNPSTAAGENANRTLFNLHGGAPVDKSNYAALLTKFEGNGVRYLNTNLIQTDAKLTQDKWNLISYVQKGTTESIYMNGNILNSTTSTRKLKDIANGKVTFGKGITWPDKGFKGSIDDIKIYKGAMSEIEISQEYQKRMYPIAGFTIGDYNASINQTTKKITLTVPDDFNLNNVSPSIASEATEIKINGTVFTAGSSINLSFGDSGTVNYTHSTGTGVYTLEIRKNTIEKLANFKFTSSNINNGNVTDLSGKNHTAKIEGGAESKTNYVNLKNGYVNLDPTLISKTGSAFTMSFTVSLNKDFAISHTLLSAGTSETNRILLQTDEQTEECDGPRWSLMTGTGDTVIRSNNFLGFEKWVNITYTQVNAEVKIYVDGVLASKGACVNSASTLGNAVTYIGKSVPNVYPNNASLNGQISEFIAYAGAMSDADVKTMYESLTMPTDHEVVDPSNGECDLLTFDYPGKECTIDITGHSINVTTTLAELGTPTVTVSNGATAEVTKDRVYITAANKLDQAVYKLNINGPKSANAQLDSVKINDISAYIDETNKTVSVALPSEFDKTNVDVIAVAKENGTASISGNSIIVKAADNNTTKTYTLNITTKKYSLAQLNSVTINGINAEIDEVGKKVSIVLPIGTDVDVVDISAIAKINGTVSVANGKITVTAEDGTKTNYTLEISIAKNKTAELNSVKINGINAVIDKTGKIVSVKLPYGAKVTSITAIAKDNGTAVVENNRAIKVTSEDGTMTARYVIKITNAPAPKPVPNPIVPPKNKIVKGKAYDKKGKIITGTVVAKVGSSYYAIIKSKVQSGTKVVKVGKKYYALKSGKVYYKTKATLLKIGKKTFTVSKKGVVTFKKLVKVGKGTYVNKSKTSGIYKKAKFKIGKKLYKADKKGVVKRSK